MNIKVTLSHLINDIPFIVIRTWRIIVPPVMIGTRGPFSWTLNSDRRLWDHTRWVFGQLIVNLCKCITTWKNVRCIKRPKIGKKEHDEFYNDVRFKVNLIHMPYNLLASRIKPSWWICDGQDRILIPQCGRWCRLKRFASTNIPRHTGTF